MATEKSDDGGEVPELLRRPDETEGGFLARLEGWRQRAGSPIELVRDLSDKAKQLAKELDKPKTPTPQADGLRWIERTAVILTSKEIDVLRLVLRRSEPFDHPEGDEWTRLLAKLTAARRKLNET